MQFGIGHPHLHMNCSLHVWGRVQGSQIFKRNSIISIHSKSYGIFSDFVVPVVPTLSPCRPRHPHIITVLSPSSPCRPHSPQKVPMWSPWLWSPWSPPHVVPVVPMLSLLSPCHPRRPHIIPVLSLSSPHRLEGPHIIPNPPRYQLHPPATPLGGVGPRISKNAIRFELIEIF